MYRLILLQYIRRFRNHLKSWSHVNYGPYFQQSQPKTRTGFSVYPIWPNLDAVWPEILTVNKIPHMGSKTRTGLIHPIWKEKVKETRWTLRKQMLLYGSLLASHTPSTYFSWLCSRLSQGKNKHRPM